MKTKDIWILDYCVPAIWTNDLTPPPDWDYALQPGTWDYFANEVGEMFSVVGEGFTAYYEQLAKGVAPVVELLKEAQYTVMPVFEELFETQRILDEDELKKNGQHIVKSQKKGIELPKRITNSGPPAPRLDRKRK